MRTLLRWLLAVPVVLASAVWGAPYRAVELTAPGVGGGVGAMFRGAYGDWAVGGTVRNGIAVQAMVWDVQTGKAVSLHSPAWTYSDATGVFGDRIVGYARHPNGEIQAVQWKLTGGQWVATDIRPTGATYSTARDTWGAYSAGASAYGNAINRATLWSHGGGGNFAVDITPAGYDQAVIEGTDGSRQVGYAFTDTVTHAILWRLTRESAVSLHPTRSPEFYKYSWGQEAGGGQQVGWAGTGLGAVQHAMVWTDTAESAVDLNPPGYVFSDARDTNGRQQVGYASLTGGFGNGRAMVWSGTAESGVDLHSLLEPGVFARSYGFVIDDWGNVYGHAIDTAGVYHAIKWEVVPEPAMATWAAIVAAWLAGRRRMRASEDVNAG